MKMRSFFIFLFFPFYLTHASFKKENACAPTSCLKKGIPPFKLLPSSKHIKKTPKPKVPSFHKEFSFPPETHKQTDPYCETSFFERENDSQENLFALPDLGEFHSSKDENNSLALFFSPTSIEEIKSSYDLAPNSPVIDTEILSFKDSSNNLVPEKSPVHSSLPLEFFQNKFFNKNTCSCTHTAHITSLYPCKIPTHINPEEYIKLLEGPCIFENFKKVHTPQSPLALFYEELLKTRGKEALEHMPIFEVFLLEAALSAFVHLRTPNCKFVYHNYAWTWSLNDSFFATTLVLAHALHTLIYCKSLQINLTDPLFFHQQELKRILPSLRKLFMDSFQKISLLNNIERAFHDAPREDFLSTYATLEQFSTPNSIDPSVKPIFFIDFMKKALSITASCYSLYDSLRDMLISHQPITRLPFDPRKENASNFDSSHLC